MKRLEFFSLSYPDPGFDDLVGFWPLALKEVSNKDDLLNEVGRNLKASETSLVQNRLLDECITKGNNHKDCDQLGPFDFVPRLALLPFDKGSKQPVAKYDNITLHSSTMTISFWVWNGMKFNSLNESIEVLSFTSPSPQASNVVKALTVELLTRENSNQTLVLEVSLSVFNSDDSKSIFKETIHQFGANKDSQQRLDWQFVTLMLDLDSGSMHGIWEDWLFSKSQSNSKEKTTAVLNNLPPKFAGTYSLHLFSSIPKLPQPIDSSVVCISIFTSLLSETDGKLLRCHCSNLGNCPHRSGFFGPRGIQGFWPLDWKHMFMEYLTTAENVYWSDEMNKTRSNLANSNSISMDKNIEFTSTSHNLNLNYNSSNQDFTLFFKLYLPSDFKLNHDLIEIITVEKTFKISLSKSYLQFQPYSTTSSAYQPSHKMLKVTEEALGNWINYVWIYRNDDGSLFLYSTKNFVQLQHEKQMVRRLEIKQGPNKITLGPLSSVQISCIQIYAGNLDQIKDFFYLSTVCSNALILRSLYPVLSLQRTKETFENNHVGKECRAISAKGLQTDWRNVNKQQSSNAQTLIHSLFMAFSAFTIAVFV